VITHSYPGVNRKRPQLKNVRSKASRKIFAEGAAADLLQFVIDLRESGSGARFVFIAAGSAAHSDGADCVVPHLDGQPAASIKVSGMMRPADILAMAFSISLEAVCK
jgi:hypothetical protein